MVHDSAMKLSEAHSHLEPSSASSCIKQLMKRCRRDLRKVETFLLGTEICVGVTKHYMYDSVRPGTVTK